MEKLTFLPKMINPTERARDALCGDRQTSASTTGILLKSELLVLKMLQVCRQSSAISLKPPETMNRINARHASGWEGNTELGQRALPGEPGQPSQQRTPLALVRIAQQPLACSCRAWSHRVRCLGVAEATGDVGRWQGQARGDGGELGAVQRCAGFPGPADGTHIARSRRPAPWDKSHRNPHRPAWPWPAKHPGLHWDCERASLSFSPFHPPVQRTTAVCSFTWVIDSLAGIPALAAAAEISVSALRNISLCTQSPTGQPELHPRLQHLGVGMANLAGKAPGWLSEGRTPPPILVENVVFSLAVLQFSFWE